MKLHGMASAFRQWLDQPKGKDIAPADLVGMLVDAESLFRDGRKLTTRLRKARFRISASVEDINYAHARGLSKSVMLELGTCR